MGNTNYAHPTNVYYNTVEVSGRPPPQTILPRHAKHENVGDSDGYLGWCFVQNRPTDSILVLTRPPNRGCSGEKNGYLPLCFTTCGCPYVICGPLCLSVQKIDRGFFVPGNVNKNDIDPLIDELDTILYHTQCPSCTRVATCICGSRFLDYHLMTQRWQLMKAAVDNWNAQHGHLNVFFDLAYNPGGLDEPDVDVAYLFDKNRPYNHQDIPWSVIEQRIKQALQSISSPGLYAPVPSSAPAPAPTQIPVATTGGVAANVVVPEGYALALVPISQQGNAAQSQAI
eukprot:gene24152-29212_t